MAQTHEDVMLERFRALAQRYEISDYFASKLRKLEGWEIVLILDDSGSMNTPLDSQPSGGAFGKSQTRWSELKQTVEIIIDIASVMDKDGLDLYFLNRATVTGVSSSAQVANVFAAPPAGLTPTTPVLRHVLQTKKAVSAEKRVLVIIATDGAPTNAQGEVDIAGLKHVLQAERDPTRFHVQFIACTDDPSTVSYLSQWDRELPNVDVSDDYKSERAEILKAKGNNFSFSYGSYVVKALLGSIDPEFDKLDEKQAAGCCSVQ